MKVWRPNTTDEKVIDEVLRRNVYERKKMNFLLSNCDVWLDLGGNIGTFALKAANAGCKVISFEPEPENFEILVENTQHMNVTPVQMGVVASAIKPTIPLYICKGTYNKYRHTIFSVRGRQQIDIKVCSFMDTLDRYKPDGVKMDIEGAELDILDNMELWPDYVTHLVFEYSFDKDKSIKRFIRIISLLKDNFDEVHHPKFDLTKENYEFYPPAVIVYAKRSARNSF